MHVHSISNAKPRSFRVPPRSASFAARLCNERQRTANDAATNFKRCGNERHLVRQRSGNQRSNDAITNGKKWQTRRQQREKNGKQGGNKEQKTVNEAATNGKKKTANQTATKRQPTVKRRGNERQKKKANKAETNSKKTANEAATNGKKRQTRRQ